jgi:hypothetical protein
MRSTVAAGVVTLFAAASLQAHHSASMFVLAEPVWVQASVVGLDRVNPHSIIHLEERTPDGQVRRWAVEGPAAAQLERRGIEIDFLRPGDVIEVCGFALKEEFRAARSPQTGEGYPRDFLHGHVLVLPDERMRTWGSYGKLENCIRSGDRVEQWLDFVNGDESAQRFWCSSRNSVAIPSTASPEFVAAVNTGMQYPCN